MRKLSLILFAGLLTACAPKQQDIPDGVYNPQRLRYYQDTQTQLCFAVFAYARTDSGGGVAAGMSHTYVPCSPQVLQRIDQQAQKVPAP